MTDQFYKLLAGNLCHNGFTYKEGLNVDRVPFDPSGECQCGGLYFTNLENIPLWSNSQWTLIADVTVPNDARVYAEPCGTKWKADRLVLSNIRPLSKFLAALDEPRLCAMLRKNGAMLEHIENQTEAMRWIAVQQCGAALKYVTMQSEALCLVAVRQNWRALVYVKNQTEEICLFAVQKEGWALELVRNQTEAICRAAMAQNPNARHHVKIPIDF